MLQQEFDEKNQDQLKDKQTSPENPRNCILYHLLIGSTPPETVTQLDFPDGRLAKFIEEELQ